jgi:hypothetical protein
MTIKITNLEYRKRFGISDRTALLDLTVICILTRHKTDISINKYDMSAVNLTYKEDKRGQKDIAE